MTMSVLNLARMPYFLPNELTSRNQTLRIQRLGSLSFGMFMANEIRTPIRLELFPCTSRVFAGQLFVHMFPIGP